MPSRATSPSGVSLLHSDPITSCTSAARRTRADPEPTSDGIVDAHLQSDAARSGRVLPDGDREQITNLLLNDLHGQFATTTKPSRTRRRCGTESDSADGSVLPLVSRRVSAHLDEAHVNGGFAVELSQHVQPIE